MTVLSTVFLAGMTAGIQATMPDTSRLSVILFHDRLVTSLVVDPVQGAFAPGNPGAGAGASDPVASVVAAVLASGQPFYVSVYGDGLLIASKDTACRVNGPLHLVPRSGNAILVIRPVRPFLEARKYGGEVFIRSRDGTLFIVNRTALDDYLAGVAETEGGPAAPEEYYKAQIILCRTYAILHHSRHGSEGASLCDGVHCQSYHGLPLRNDRLKGLAMETSGAILTGPDSLPVEPAFHANSGGYTRNSADVWLRDLPYLRSMKDDFSLAGRQATWKRAVSFGAWRHYLALKGFGLPPVLGGAELEFHSRKPARYYVVRGDSLPFIDLRRDWHLPSDYFDVRYTEGRLDLMGKGYGHGLGMSQEGAMEMARQGHTCKEILDHYFRSCRILDYRPDRERE